MHFEVQGPFDFYRTRARLIDNSAEARRLYWEWVDDFVSGLADACGCYIFTINTSNGALPWYIGKAERQPFRKECLSAHKVNHYNNAIAGRTGTPCIFFVPQLTRAGKYRKPTTTKRRAISELESLLIGMAIARNPRLLNARGTRWYQQLTVDGLSNSRPARKGPAQKLSKVLNL
jgi:hypothetical protein